MRAGYPVVEIAMAAGIFLAANGVYGLDLMIGRNLPVGEDIANTSAEGTALNSRVAAAGRQSLCIASSSGQYCDQDNIDADVDDEESSLHGHASSDTITLFVLPE